MKKLIILIVNCILVVGCNTSISSTYFFSRISVNNIEYLSEDTLTFSTSYIDPMFKSHGTIFEPNIPFSIKYDTLSRYTVIAVGNVFFFKPLPKDIAEIKSDSIELSSVIVIKKGERAKRYSSKLRQESDFDKPWKDCPIPSSVMKKIRKDFFIRMKYQKYGAISNDSLNGITVMHQYQLF